MSNETAPLPQIKITWLVGILAAFTIFALIAGYSGHMTRAYPNWDQQRANDRYATLQKVRADEDKILNAPADWIDQTKKTIHIPIDEAMAREVDILKDQPAHACASIMPGLPAPTAAAPATASTPASTNAAPSAPTKPTP